MLHGDIRLNEIVIGEYTARRVNVPRQEFNTYECTFWIRKQDGYLYTAEWQIWGNHHGNGAASLAARVIQEGNTRAKRKPVGE